MARKILRRHFLRLGAAAAGAIAAPAVFGRSILGANEKLNIAGIGVGGKGESDIGHCESENVVALCDVDERNAAGSFKKFPQAIRYKDYRVMLEKEKGIDAVTVSTPDHHHAPASLLAMRLGKHVYCQKPLTHSVHEARLMAEVAREKKVATQMGNQGAASPFSRRLVELIQGGVLGRVRQVHIWTDRPIWPQGIGRPEGTPPVPAHLAWDLWLGPAPVRPYHEAYVPFKWRGFWDFGTGALGDMGCHNMNLAFLALKLRDPLGVEATASGMTSETYPKSSVIRYEFPARGEDPPVQLAWYDGDMLPPAELVKGETLGKNGHIFVGEKDTLYVSDNRRRGAFLSGAKMEDFQSIPERLPRRGDADVERKGQERNMDLHHRLEWIEAAKGGPPGLSNFDHAGPMTEAVLLGNVALKAGKKIEWDSKAFRVTNVPEANAFLRREYRAGWPA